MSPSINAERFITLIDYSVELFKKKSGTIKTLDIKDHLTVFGDVHGDLTAIKHLKKNIINQIADDKNHKIVFLGDYIDRGPFQIQVLEELLAIYTEYPDQVILLRGNHEGPEDISVSLSDFSYKLSAMFKGKKEMIQGKLSQLFAELYIAAVIPEKTLIIHGGFSSTKSMNDIRNAVKQHPSKPHLTEILWSDPSNQKEDLESTRGLGRRYGIKSTHEFLEKNNLKSLIRGHQHPKKGYSVDNGKILTLCSTNFNNPFNKIGYLDISGDESFEVEDLVKHVILVKANKI